VAEIEVAIDIAAPPERVWAIVADLARYREWNPFIPSASGQVQVGARLELEIRPDGGRSMRFRPTVIVADAGHELRWLGRVGLPGLFDGTHTLRVEPNGQGGSRFVEHESFRGILVPLVWRGNLRRGTERGFAQMAAALKARAEGTATAR
jgi:hypothetical protein